MFNHIYVEHAIASHSITKHILSNVPRATTIGIENYKQFFNRPNQNFMAQRGNLKLILAKQEDHFLHEGTDRVRSFGDTHVVSCSMVRNCMYHCEYCFLSGMHESAHIVIYVNIEDYEGHVRALAQKLSPQPIYLVSSYLSDLPILEKYVPICRMWMDITESLDNVDLEIRTKGDAYTYLQPIGARSHTVLTWSFSPQSIVRKYEHGTAALHTRILHASQAIRDGWRVRLCFDPILYYENWEEDYAQCVEHVFSRCPPEKVEMVSFGVFRMGSSYLQRMRRARAGAGVLQKHVVSHHGLGTYSQEIVRTIQSTFTSLLSKYLPKEKYHFVHG